MRNVALVRRTADLPEMVVHGSVFFVANACYVSHLIARGDFDLLHMPRLEHDLLAQKCRANLSRLSRAG